MKRIKCFKLIQLQPDRSYYIFSAPLFVLYPLFGPYVLFHLSLIFHILNITCASSSGLEDLALLKTSVTNTKYQCLSCLLVQSGNVGIIWLLI